MKHFLKTSFLGGVLVVLPIGVLGVAFRWLFSLIRGWIHPLTIRLFGLDEGQSPTALEDLFVIVLLFVLCFCVGLIVRTKVGKLIHNLIERYVLKLAPGYNLVKETVMALFGKGSKPFRQVGLARLYAGDVWVTCFITDEHADGNYTVFVPTGPNPTSGMIFHLAAHRVRLVETKIEDAMRSIISCGAGSSTLMLAAGTSAVPGPLHD